MSKASLTRSLDIANSLFTVLEDRGHEVVFAPRDQYMNRHAFDEREKGGPTRHYSDLWSPARSTVVFIGTVAIGLTIFEMTEEIEVVWQNGKYVRKADLATPKHKRYANSQSWTHKHHMPSGKLCLQAYSPYQRTQWQRQWRETKIGDLQSKCLSIAKELERETAAIALMVAEAERQAQIEQQQREEQWQRWQVEEAERRHAKSVMDSREKLFGIIEDWAKAQQIEKFLKDAEQSAAELSEDHREAVLDRLKQARDLLGGVDTLQRFLLWNAPE